MTGTSAVADDFKRRVKASSLDGRWVVEFFYDKGVQVRLSRGFEVWSHYYESATGSDPFRIMRRKIDSTGIISDTQSKMVSSLFLDYILLVLLHHHAAMILMHEELKIFVDVGSHLPYWLDTDSGSPLPSHIPLDRYIQWAKTREARYVVSVACLYLVRLASGQRFLHKKQAENFFLSVIAYYSVLIVWLYSLAIAAEDQQSVTLEMSGVIDKEQVMSDASAYLYHMWEITHNSRNRPALGLGVLPASPTSSSSGHSPVSHPHSPPVSSVASVVALGALLLRNNDVGLSKSGGDVLYALFKRLSPRSELAD
jgi:hypothetical protein